ncbi:MAG: ABC transporter permease subunit [Planctomycetes bacterium]|nr:ABC transporter permease subunit [Planctomycetota bacterium]
MTTISGDRVNQYQRWQGALGKSHWTWPAIVRNGITLALKHNKTRIVLLTGGIPAVTAVGVLYVLSLLESLVGTDEAKGMYDLLSAMLRINIHGVTRLVEFRDVLWRSTFLMMTGMQMFWVLIIVARVGTPLIANDLKHRALPIYFSKPVTPATYLLGKWAVAASFVALITLVPSFAAFAVSLLLTDGPGTWGQAARLANDLILTGMFVCVTSGAVIIALSSITSDQRYVTVGWVAICLLPMFAQKIINESLPSNATMGWIGCISLRDDIFVVAEHLLHVRKGLAATSLPAERFAQALTRPIDPAKAATVLGVLTVSAIFFSWRRVVRFSRMAAAA